MAKYLKKHYRLTRDEDFQRVRREGRSWANTWLVLVASPNSMDHSRFGFSVGKRIGKAVQRNRVKRLLREAAHQNLERVAPGWDLVFIARPPMQVATFSQVRAAMSQLLWQTHLLLDEGVSGQDAGYRAQAD